MQYNTFGTKIRQEPAAKFGPLESFFGADFLLRQSSYGPDIQTDWIIWKTAEPITTNTNRAISSGLTGYLSSDLDDFVTLPLLLMFLAFFSFAFLICGVLGILVAE
eukprot:GFUD01029752.1.p2 GENE.GFUD01029752.1~~GFUD01029752.1.p2  ORF type:complete len:106 (+),score=1.33 GFUD01029752.1:166-483(+)